MIIDNNKRGTKSNKSVVIKMTVERKGEKRKTKKEMVADTVENDMMMKAVMVCA